MQLPTQANTRHSVVLPAFLKNSLDNMTMYIRQPEPATLVSIGEAFVVDSKLVQKRGLEIMNMDWITRDVVAQRISFTVRHATFDTTTSHPDGKASWVMVTSEIG